LIAHPEGGFYREIHRSSQQVIQISNGDHHSAMTTIYFLLIEGKYSHWHRIGQDEIWHFYEGAPLELIWIDKDGFKDQVIEIVGKNNQQVAVLPAGCWQAARTTGAYTLVGCCVGPGFEFKDFELLSSQIEEERNIRTKYPDLWKRVENWGEGVDKV